MLQNVTSHRLHLLPHPAVLRHINPFIPNGLFYFNSLVRFISYTGVSGSDSLLPCFVGISELNANNVDPDQMTHSAGPDLGLHCLPMSLLWDARLKWVNKQPSIAEH